MISGLLTLGVTNDLEIPGIGQPRIWYNTCEAPHFTPPRSASVALHPFAQDRIDPAEVSLAFRFEPGEDIVVNSEGDL